MNATRSAAEATPERGAASEETPLMRQWREVKEKHLDALVFFRVGDFFELFHDDALEASRLLGLTLTSRNNGAASEVPMAGVPARALDDYLARLVRQGRRVAICDQVEDPALAKGIVRREVVETVTPGTTLQENLLQPGRNNFLVAVTPPANGQVGIAAADLSTGDFTLSAVELGSLSGEIGRIAPSEVLLPRSMEDAAVPGLPTPERMSGGAVSYRPDWTFEIEVGEEELRGRFGVLTLDGLGFEKGDALLVCAAGALANYVREIQPSASSPLRVPRIVRPGTEMALDEMTRRNLELVEPLRSGEEGGTLDSVLDESVTPMGGRLLRQWILRPLTALDAIWRRQEAVAELLSDRERRSALRKALSQVHDIERLAVRVGAARVTPRELLSLGRSLALLPKVKQVAEGVESDLLREAAVEVDLMEEVGELIAAGISDSAPQSLQEGGVIREGFSPELDDLRRVRDGARDFIASLQQRERERTGISSLKVGYNRVFGYYLEITRTHLARVPEDYIRKQTLANAERYFTPELKEWEEKVAGAEDSIASLEAQLFQELRTEVAGEVGRLQEVGRKIALLDLLCALAQTAERRGYVRPEMHSGFALEVRAGRHPVVETMMPREDFIPNDLVLDENGSIIVLTGPNMAGKSTILRQVGLIQLMAQMGSFVPATSARLPVCDRIFTRVGASDNLARGQSTFMVEMNETAAILHGAGERSLILLDEIGRGTSTYDGVSIAWAVTEYIHEKVRAKTIFATHYHELTQLGDLLGGVKNMNVAVKESGDGIVFLRRLVEGGADRSYGIQVARLAGLPSAIISRAMELLTELEGAHSGGGAGLGQRSAGRPAASPPRAQLSLFHAEDPLVTRLRRLELESMTPLEALHFLDGLRGEARRREGEAEGKEGET